MTEALSEHRSEWFSEWFDDGGFFTVRVRFDDPLHLVVMSGELDLASHEAAVRACTLSDHLQVVVDMAGLTFMDCSGYRALDAARTILERRCGSLSLINAGGEPLRLLSLIAQGARDPASLLRRPFQRQRNPDEHRSIIDLGGFEEHGYKVLRQAAFVL